jgi:hypothetical protein
MPKPTPSLLLPAKEEKRGDDDEEEDGLCRLRWDGGAAADGGRGRRD